MDQRRKVTLAALFVMTVLLAGVSIFITIRIQQNNAATDANASGFGVTATTDLYDNVADAFDKQACDVLIDKTKLSTLVSGLTYTFTVTAKGTDYPKTCNYVFSNGVEANFTLYAYKTNSNIPNSAEELYDIVNTYSESEFIRQDSINNTVSFYGTDYGNADYCRLNLFNTQNEFYYASLVYTKKLSTSDACDSFEMQDFNLDLFQILGPSIDKVIIDVSKANGKVPN